MNLNNCTKEELITIASWYNVELKVYKPKKYMMNIVEELLEKQEQFEECEEVQMSARIKRIKEQNDGT